MTLPLLMGSAVEMAAHMCPDCNAMAWLTYFAGIGTATILYVGLHYLLKD